MDDEPTDCGIVDVVRGGELQKKLFWNGCHVKWTGDSAIVAPSFVATKENIDEIVGCLEKTLKEV